MPRSLQKRLSQLTMSVTVSLALMGPLAPTKANEADHLQTATMAAQLLSQSPVMRRVSIEWLRDVGGEPAIPPLFAGSDFLQMNETSSLKPSKH